MDHIYVFAWIIAGSLHGSELGLCMDQSRDSAWFRGGTLVVECGEFV